MASPVQGLYNWYRQLIRNPKYRWWVIGGTLFYLLSPFDLLPEAFLPFIGEIDDLVILSFLVAEVTQLLGDRIKTVKTRKDATETVASTDAASTNPVDVEAVSVK
ncbi:MAG: DUF1232 domain-containing protein [Leptolyngbyaceae cyanobacterium SL_7_1]|nr:DUF1232 domain-containing protein [Leptolyngbyaceae cyanobacterium SL_7_1]